jgi:hypothetical protein
MATTGGASAAVMRAVTTSARAPSLSISASAVAFATTATTPRQNKFAPIAPQNGALRQNVSPSKQHDAFSVRDREEAVKLLVKKRNVTCYCDFCGKSDDEVSQMVDGKHAYICGQCVEVAVRLVRNPPLSLVTAK